MALGRLFIVLSTTLLPTNSPEWNPETSATYPKVVAEILIEQHAMREDIADLRQEMREEIGGLRQEIGSLRQDLQVGLEISA